MRSMDIPLSPALAIIFIQYSKNALPQPYTDFERFEIYSTLLEELDPLETYEYHQPRIESDPRSFVIESDRIRCELYNSWSETARSARRPGNSAWNKFIAFVNAQLKFHIDLKFEHFKYLCDGMAGYRLSSLTEPEKFRLFWGCVLRREHRFTRIQQIIDSRDRLELFVGPTGRSDGAAKYVARLSVGLRMPIVPLAPQHHAQEKHGYREIARLSVDNLPTVESQLQPLSNSAADLKEPVYDYEAIFEKDFDVMELVRRLHSVDREFGTLGADSELLLSEAIHEITAKVRNPSEAMQRFGKMLEHGVKDSILYACEDMQMPKAAMLKLCEALQVTGNYIQKDFAMEGDQCTYDMGNFGSESDVTVEKDSVLLGNPLVIDTRWGQVQVSKLTGITKAESRGSESSSSTGSHEDMLEDSLSFEIYTDQSGDMLQQVESSNTPTAYENGPHPLEQRNSQEIGNKVAALSLMKW